MKRIIIGLLLGSVALVQVAFADGESCIKSKQPKAMYALLMQSEIRAAYNSSTLPNTDALVIAAWDENHFGEGNTPLLQDVNGDYYFTTHLTDEEMANLPSKDLPVLDFVWKSTDNCGTELEPEQCPWPTVTRERDVLDQDGNPTGETVQYQQGVGRVKSVLPTIP